MKNLIRKNVYLLISLLIIGIYTVIITITPMDSEWVFLTSFLIALFSTRILIYFQIKYWEKIRGKKFFDEEKFVIVYVMLLSVALISIHIIFPDREQNFLPIIVVGILGVILHYVGEKVERKKYGY